MSTEIQQAGIYHDIQSLTKLKTSAQKDAVSALPEVARQFEAYFIQQMLKEMRATLPGDELFANGQGDFYQDMLDRQLSVNFSTKNSLGLADLLVQQLTASRGTLSLPHSAAVTGPVHQQLEPASGAANELSPAPSAVSLPTTSSITHHAKAFSSPEDFIKTLWPHAMRAGKELGLDPRVLLAQSALETGWGKALSAHADGGISHNLFNIKADSRWMGARVTIPTLEFEAGTPRMQHATFRSYESFSDSFDDYVSFLKADPRYSSAVKAAADAEIFIDKLANSGYATDPEYGSKIKRILDSKPMNDAVRDLKELPPWPLS